MSDANNLRDMTVWFLRHVFGNVPEDLFLNFRVIKNLPPVEGQTKKKIKAVTLYNRNIPKRLFAKIWRESLFRDLSFYNAEGGPANIYFGVNPRSNSGISDENRKDNIPAVFCINLDLDITREYSEEDRLSQISFLNFIGIHPIVTHSGHGFQAFFMLEEPLPTEEGETLNQELIVKFGCKGKGNTHDCTRIMRLPGFLNQKFWFNGDSPPCIIVRPGSWESVPNFFLGNPRFTKERIAQIPNGTKEFLAKIKETAKKMPGEELDLSQKVALLLEKIRQEGISAAFAVKAAEISREGHDAALAVKAKAVDFKSGVLDAVPHPDNLKFPKHSKFWRKYCIAGFEGLIPKDIDEIAFALKMEDKSASAFDFRLLRLLLKMNFSVEAIREFWFRPDLGLNRTEKHEGYFDLSLENAVKQHQAAIEQKLQKALESPIFEDGNETFFRSPSQAVFKVLNCSIITLRVLNQCEGGITGESFLETEIKFPCENGSEPLIHKTTIRANALDSWKELKKSLPFRVCILTGAENILGHLKHHLLRNFISDVDAQEEIGVKITYHTGKFYLPNFRITKEGIEHQPFYNPSVGHDLVSQFGKEAIPLERIKEILNEKLLPFVTCHKPSLVYAVMGIAGAAVLKPMFQTDLKIPNFPIPSLNVRGKPSTGKSFTVPKLLSVLGWMGESGQSSFGIKTTDFACQKLFHFFNWFPVLFDEFKESTFGDKQCCERIRMWCRKGYSGEIDLKGTYDQRLISYFINAPFIIMGEHEAATEEIALVTRMMVADSTGYDVSNPQAKNTWLRIQRTDFRVLGPHIFQFALNSDTHAHYQHYLDFKQHFEKVFQDKMGHEKERISHNFAAYCCGIRFLKDFFSSLDPELGKIFLSPGNPVEILTEPYLRWIAKREFFHLQRHETVDFAPQMRTEDPGEPRTAPQSIGEPQHERHVLFDFLRIMCDLIRRRHHLVRDMIADGVPIFDPPLESEDFEHSISACLDLSTAYPAYREYLQKSGDTPVHKNVLVADIHDLYQGGQGKTVLSEVKSLKLSASNKYFPGKRIKEGFRFNPESLTGYNIF